jgi:hypothetical protein
MGALASAAMGFNIPEFVDRALMTFAFNKTIQMLKAKKTAAVPEAPPQEIQTSRKEVAQP